MQIRCPACKIKSIKLPKMLKSQRLFKISLKKKSSIGMPRKSFKEETLSLKIFQLDAAYLLRI